MKKLLFMLLPLIMAFHVNIYAKDTQSWDNIYFHANRYDPYESYGENSGIIKIIPVSGILFALSGHEGVLKLKQASDDTHNSNWINVGSGVSLPEHSPFMELIAGNGGHLLLVDKKNVYQSSSIQAGQLTWVPVEQNGFPLHDDNSYDYGRFSLTSIIQDTEGTLYASFQDESPHYQSSVEGCDVYRLTNQGKTWVNLKVKDVLPLVKKDPAEANFSQGYSDNEPHLKDTHLALDSKDNLYLQNYNAIFKFTKGTQKWEYFTEKLPAMYIDDSIIVDDNMLVMAGDAHIAYENVTTDANKSSFRAYVYIASKNHWYAVDFNGKYEVIRSLTMDTQQNIYGVASTSSRRDIILQIKLDTDNLRLILKRVEGSDIASKQQIHSLTAYNNSLYAGGVAKSNFSNTHFFNEFINRLKTIALEESATGTGDEYQMVEVNSSDEVPNPKPAL